MMAVPTTETAMETKFKITYSGTFETYTDWTMCAARMRALILSGVSEVTLSLTA